jgi:hypothetical protein
LFQGLEKSLMIPRTSLCIRCVSLTCPVKSTGLIGIIGLTGVAQTPGCAVFSCVFGVLVQLVQLLVPRTNSTPIQWLRGLGQLG